MEGLKSLLNIIKIFIKDFSPSYNNIKLFCKYGPKIRQKRGNVELSLAIQRKTFQDSCDEILCHHFNESPLVLPLYLLQRISSFFVLFGLIAAENDERKISWKNRGGLRKMSTHQKILLQTNDHN